MFERFTDRARRVLVLAQEEARLLDHNFVGTEHLLLGLVREGEGVAAVVLTSAGVSLDEVRDRVRRAIGATEEPATGDPPFTPRAKKVLELSLREALQLGHNHLGTEHLLLALIREGGGVAVHLLRDLGVEPGRLRQDIVELLTPATTRTAAGTAQTPPAGPAATAQSPRCRHCLAELEVSARARRIGVAEDAGGPPVPVMFVYCGSCGRAIVGHVEPVTWPPPAV